MSWIGLGAMFYCPRTRLRFSLRSLFIAMTLLAVVIGAYAERIRSNQFAVDTLRRRGVLVGSCYLDPIGPDCIYTGSFGDIPPKGSFDPWFEKTFCTECDLVVTFGIMKVNASDIDLLSRLQIGFGVTFMYSCLAEGMVKRLSEKCSVPLLAFEGISLSDDDCRHLAGMRSLRKLYVDRDRISPEGLAILRMQRPDLDVEICDPRSEQSN